MSVRAKFYIAEITQFPGTTGGRVKMSAVSRGTRNSSWSTATPAGSIEMSITNPEAFEWFQRLLQRANSGQGYPEMFITFDEADDGRVGDGHAFESSGLPETHYAHTHCAACGIPADKHVPSAA